MNITLAGTRSPVVKGSVGRTMPALAGSDSRVARNTASGVSALLVQPRGVAGMAREFREMDICMSPLTAR